jgi:phosphatidylglycerophosphatase A
VKAFTRFIATLGPSGYAPIAPATAGSAVVTLIGWFLPVPPLWVTLVLIALGTVVAVWVAGEAEKDLGHDAKPIVADEAVGQSLALLFVPHTAAAFFAAFFLFRVFDVWKPLGAREAQVLPGGYGIVADDVIAGITSCAFFHVATLAAVRWLHVSPWEMLAAKMHV